MFRRFIEFFVIGSMILNTIIIKTHLKTVIQKHTRNSLVNAELAKLAFDFVVNNDALAEKSVVC